MARSERRQQQRQEAQQEKRVQPPTRRGRFSRVQLIAASVVAMLGVIALVYVGNASAPPPTTTLPPTITQNGHTRGLASAPVTIEEWGDFQCPACGQFARTTETQLISTYIAKGQVALVFHHMAFLGPESDWSAEAAECAGEQGRFFDYHDKLYASQAGENRGTFSKNNLKRFGTEMGLSPAFATCVDSGKYTQTVRADTTLGQDRGVQATPTFFINGRKIEGAASFDQLKAIIDPLLVGR